jgi:hypothetical protein
MQREIWQTRRKSGTQSCGATEETLSQPGRPNVAMTSRARLNVLRIPIPICTGDCEDARDFQ